MKRLKAKTGRRRSDMLGDSFTALCGGALALNLLLVVGILALLAWNGGRYFWQRDLVELTMKNGTKVLGELWEEEKRPTVGDRPGVDRLRLKIGNRDLVGLDFAWVDRQEIASMAKPVRAVLLERLEYGNFYGTIQEIRSGGRVVASGPDASWRALGPLHRQKMTESGAVEDLEKGEIGDINAAIEKLRLRRKKLDLLTLAAVEKDRRIAALDGELALREAEYQKLADRLTAMREALERDTVVLAAVDGATKEVPLSGIVHAIRPNAMSGWSKSLLYVQRIWSFIADDPRESNTEGGIFPAIFGTVMMVFLMSFAVVPLGVLAATYLREYAKQGPLVRMVRIAVNNLAGVPSIVFGVFGLGFFVYLIGGSIDRVFYPESLPTPTFGTGGILWASLTLALLTVPVVIVAAEEGLAAVPRIVREGSLALGATKFETLWRVVLPAAAPGILTGMILAMARAAGEVAPLMIVGMVKLAPALPVDGHAPFVHFERKFMHLGFHIYDVGFQSPNIEATTPLVFATALLLIIVVTIMNLAAIGLRNHLRKKYAGSAV